MKVFAGTIDTAATFEAIDKTLAEKFIIDAFSLFFGVDDAAKESVKALYRQLDTVPEPNRSRPTLCQSKK